MDLKDQLEEDFDWGDPQGGVDRKIYEMVGAPPKEFWNLWRDYKEEIRDLGIGVRKNEDTGEFEVTWYKQNRLVLPGEAAPVDRIKITKKVAPLVKRTSSLTPAQEWAVQWGLGELPLDRDAILVQCPVCQSGTLHIHAEIMCFFCFGGDKTCWVEGKDVKDLNALYFPTNKRGVPWECVISEKIS